jgi:hypothetical protein
MPDPEAIEKRRQLVLEGIAVKLPMLFLMLGLTLSAVRVRYFSLAGNLLLAFGMLALNGLRMKSQFRAAVNLSAALWGAGAFFAYKRFSLSVGEYEGVKTEVRLSFVVYIVAVITVMYSLNYLQRKFRLTKLGTLWVLTCGIVHTLLLAAGAAALGFANFLIADVLTGASLAILILLAARVYNSVMDIVYGREKAVSEEEDSCPRSHKPEGNKTAADNDPADTYCLYCYYPVHDPLIEKAVRCENCGKVTSPFLWKKFQTLEPFVRHVENMVKAGIVIFFLLCSVAILWLFRTQSHIARPGIFSCIAGMWAILATPMLLMASHISERDRRGPFETLWAKRIRDIQKRNKWV